MLASSVLSSCTQSLSRYLNLLHTKHNLELCLFPSFLRTDTLSRLFLLYTFDTISYVDLALARCNSHCTANA